MATKYIECQEAAEIARELIADHYPNLDSGDIVFFLFTKYDGKGFMKHVDKCGDKLGYARLHPTETRVVLEVPSFGIGLLGNWWNFASDEQKRCLVDHELMHCDYDDDEKPKLLKHDFEGFTDEIKRNGFWDTRLQNLEQQMRLKMEV